MRKDIFTLLFVVCFGANSFGQQGSLWSLERCINYSQQNNLNIQQSNISVRQAELILENTNGQYRPNLSGSLSLGGNFGRSIDPTTNDFVVNNILTNGFSVSGGWTLYDGGRKPNQIQQNKYDIEAAKLDVENTKNDIALQVARGYLQILLAEEQLANSQVNLKQLEDQLAQTNKLIKAGTLPANNRLDIEAQIAASEQTVVANQNSVDIAYLTLKLLLQLEAGAPFQIEKPGDLDIPSLNELTALSVDGLFESALQNQPNIAAGEMRTKSAEAGISVARSAFYPTVSIGGSLGTNYSNIGIDPTADPIVTSTGFQSNDVDIIIGGQQTTVTFLNETFDVSLPRAGYFNQFRNNLNGFFGLSVNIPIYNGGLTKNSIEQAKLNVLNNQFGNRILRQNLNADVQRALTDAKAAAKQLEAAEKSVAAQQASFENTQKRFDIGTANSFEFNTARNNLEASKALYILAKYDYIFKVKILDFYQGKPIQLK